MECKNCGKKYHYCSSCGEPDYYIDYCSPLCVEAAGFLVCTNCNGYINDDCSCEDGLIKNKLLLKFLKKE